MIHFKDRYQAGLLLAALLKKYRESSAVVAIGLARGGMVTAAAVADELAVPVDVMVVRKIGAPGQEELAIGALAEDGTLVLNQQLIAQARIDAPYIASATAQERTECARRVALYRASYPAIPYAGKTILLIDDGIATGMTMEAAVKMARNQKAKRVIVAVPVVPADVVADLTKIADEVIFLKAPQDFMAVGSFYDDFTQVDHEQVIALLKAHS